MKILKRTSYLSKLKKLIKHYPVTALIGARQTGKTTLARIIAEERKKDGEPVHYFDLELPTHLKRLDEPQQALENLTGLIVIDEIQRRPELFPILRVFADRKPLPARFFVLGSASGVLLKQTTESLAGRIAYVELPGFGITEIHPKDQEKLWIRGGFPSSFLAEDDELSFFWREQFIQTFLERDIPSLGIKVEPMQLWRFWQMAANYHGQIWHNAEIGRSLRISDKTIKSYLDLLTDTFMVRQLSPWYENIGKRIVKAPKFFIRDSGILHTLLNLRNIEDLQKNPKLGASWEGFALEQIIQLSNQGRNVFFWSTHGGAEMDLVINYGGKRFGFEIKYADAPSTTKSMHIAINELSLEKVFVIYPGKERYSLTEKIEVLPLLHVHDLFAMDLK